MTCHGKFFCSLLVFVASSQMLLAGDSEAHNKGLTPRSGRKASAYFKRNASSNNLTRQTSAKDLLRRLDPQKLSNRDVNGRTLLHLSAALNNTEAIYTATWNGLQVTDLDHFNMSPFHHAAKFGRMESFLLLLVKGDESDVKDASETDYYQEKVKDLIDTLRIIDARGNTIYKYAKDATDKQLQEFLQSIRFNGLVTRNGGFIARDCQKAPEDLSLEEESEESEDADEDGEESDSTETSADSGSAETKSKGCCIVS